MEEFYIFECPHCNSTVEVHKNEVNCSIFRHGYFYTKNSEGKITLTSQINPHASEQDCINYLKEERIIGCGMPFKMEKHENGYKAVKCGFDT